MGMKNDTRQILLENVEDLQVAGVTRASLVDAYWVGGIWIDDGSPLTESELDAFTEKFSDHLYEMAVESRRG
tara:strand:+ start:83 stop:298 length:216 start_codon:yes stop_codon:yes gene_type:complete